MNGYKQIIFNKSRSLLPNANVILFDVTTLYIESVVQDEIRDFGFSKDCKFNNTPDFRVFFKRKCTN